MPQPQEPNAWYDFAAASTLSDALRAAAKKVGDLAATRGSEMNSELSCWVGAGYERWKDDFNKQQTSLSDSVDQLGAYAVQIDNASAQARELKYGSVPQTVGPPPRSSAPRAVNHPGRPGQQSAVPSSLYTYSSVTTSHNDPVKTYVNGPLLRAIDAYFPVPAGAYHPLTAQIPDLYSGGSSPFVSRLVTLLGAVRTTDAHVHDVGKTFEDASTSGNSTWPPGTLEELRQRGIDPRSVATVTLDDATFTKDLAKTVSEEAGGDLATKFNKAGATPELLAELAKHLKDPEYLAGFFNGLDETTFKSLLFAAYPAGKPVLPALLGALSSGRLDPKICNWFVDVVDDPLLGNAAANRNKAFFDALLQDPKLSLTFFQNLDQEHLHKMLNGQFALYGTDRDGRQKLVFTLLLNSVEQLHDPASVNGFLGKVGDAMDGVTSDHPQEVRQAISAFVSYCVTQIITPPSGEADMDYLTVWGETWGDQLGDTLQPFLNWMKSSDQAITDNRQMIEGIIENIAIGLPFAFVETEGLPLTITASVLSSAFGSWMQTVAHPHIPYDQIPIIGEFFTTPNANADAVAMAYVQEQTAEFSMVVSLIQTGKVIGPDGKPLVVTSSDDILKVLNNPLDYHMNNQSIEDVLNGFRSRYKDKVIKNVVQ